MPNKTYEFDAQDLKDLLTHYTDGAVPLSGTVMGIMAHPHLQRKIGLLIDSDEWTTMDPLFLQYDGKRVRSWSKGTAGEPQWEELNETPRRQS